MSEQEFSIAFDVSARELQEVLRKIKADGWHIQQVVRTSSFNEPDLDVSSADYLIIVDKNVNR